MTAPRYILGIDLGTTHCVVAYTGAAPLEDENPEIEIFSIYQLTGPGEGKAQPLLPSFLFLPGPHDVPDKGLALPWAPDKSDLAVGRFARDRGAELPQRLVSSTKSWLCHTGVNRTEAILPWDGPEDGDKISPVDASARLLEHLKEAWNHEMASGDPEACMEAQDIYLTVPASFDAVARELTVQAARAAGLEHFTLLEEPQAAFYSWIESCGDLWREQIKVGELILVCDAGGGTTDFSLIQVTEEEGELGLRRVAVGEHLLLGGDNMDLALAYAVQVKLAAKKHKLDAWQFRGLWHSCRTAKENLFGKTGEKTDIKPEPVVVLGRGSSLIGGTLRTELTRPECESILLDGFFPLCPASDHPEEKPRVGMREMGLPYVADPAVTRHLARFLDRQPRPGEDAPDPFPSTVLFNGGVMKSPVIRERLLEVLRNWKGGEELRELPSLDLDLAVARGAAYYGLARRDRGIRIRAGTAHAYYVGVESAMPAVPGVPTPLKALCTAPFGMEEGSEAEIRGNEFGLVVGEPAVFHLLSSTVRRQDEAGEMVDDWSGEIEEVTTMEAHLSAAETDDGETMIPVWIQSRVTEVGTLEVWCVSRDDEKRRWKLEFNLREREQAG